MWSRGEKTLTSFIPTWQCRGALSGLQLAERALTDKPGLKVIIASGYNINQADVGQASEAPIIYLPKPCDPETLLSTIRECLHLT